MTAKLEDTQGLPASEKTFDLSTLHTWRQCRYRPPTPEAAQLISPELASGNFGGYTFVISNCRRSTVNGQNLYIGYQITAEPKIVGETGDRGFCTDESGEILSDPKGGINCTEPLQ